MKVLGIDHSISMLQEAKGKKSKSISSFAQSSACDIPLKTESVDFITITFALRNLHSTNILEATFKECHRVLRAGGILLTLETSLPKNAFARVVLKLYSRIATGIIGRIFSRRSNAYKYLGTSVGEFIDAHTLGLTLRKSGFSNIDIYPLSFGVAAIHRAVK